MRPRELIATQRSEILRVPAAHGARNVRIFGSVARGDDDDASDRDLLVDLEPGRNLLDLGGLLMDLRDLLHCRVDVTTAPSLRPSVRERALREAAPL